MSTILIPSLNFDPSGPSSHLLEQDKGKGHGWRLDWGQESCEERAFPRALSNIWKKH